MSRFISGDELGTVKLVSYSSQDNRRTWQCDTHILLEGSSDGRSRAIQKLAVSSAEGSIVLAAARADGSTSTFNLKEDKLDVQSEWQETRLKSGQKYVGLSVTERRVYSCTSNGALRLTRLSGSDASCESQVAILPARLAEWHLASNEQSFAYAGDEVELSVWDTERAFLTGVTDDVEASKAAADASKKRKRNDQLLPGEIWRAKNLPNDSLNLRQPVRNTAFTYLQSSLTPSQQHLLVGTQFGDVRRYDTRVARRPVSNWKGIGKTGGIGVIENGVVEHQVFVSDRGSSLYALDLRNGKISYGYKGFSGAVTTISACPSLLVSGAEDRYVRLHSTFPPSAQVGQQQEHKGEVLDQTYVKVVPTVVVWDGVDQVSSSASKNPEGGADEEDGEDVWDEMENAESDEELAGGRKKSRAK